MAAEASHDESRLHAAANASCGDASAILDGITLLGNPPASSGPSHGNEGDELAAKDVVDGEEDADQSAGADDKAALSAPAESAPPAAPHEPTEDELAQIEAAEALKAEGNAAYKEGWY